MTLLERASTVLRQMMLDTAQRQNWTGWDNATMDNVAHINIQDRELIAALTAIGEALEALNDRIALIEEKL